MNLINISKNDLAKYQDYLDEIAAAYTTSRTGCNDANKAIEARTNNLKSFLSDLHKQTEKQDQDDAKLLPSLKDRIVKFDAEMEKASVEEKKKLELRKANVQARIDEIIALQQ